MRCYGGAEFLDVYYSGLTHFRGYPGADPTFRGYLKNFEDVVGVSACDSPPHRDAFFGVDLLERADREAF